MKKANRLLKSHETILDFAFRKRVYATSVYSAIKQGKITPDLVGTSSVLMIDLKKYGNYKFRVHNPDKTALIKWFLSVDFKIRGTKAQRKVAPLMWQWYLTNRSKIKTKKARKQVQDMMLRCGLSVDFLEPISPRTDK